MLSEAEQAQETIETIPCGIRFGMTKDEINSHLEKLSLNPDSTNVSKRMISIIIHSNSQLDITKH